MEPPRPVARYRVQGVDDPELIPRVFGQFARRGLVPAFALIRRSAGLIRIQIEAIDVDAYGARILAETLRAQFLIEEVTLDFETPG
ncbi:MAG: hypothetical protein P0Y59_03585 [Candidatus Sphingomonas phytovorans]|jgi:hypothetical protein|nr:hypothetical protein [Sphingomonas sp.]WEK00791.1 MAG: hypothetical protein P0Y59_03585 [Sphingomonas sp.]